MHKYIFTYMTTSKIQRNVCTWNQHSKFVFFRFSLILSYLQNVRTSIRVQAHAVNDADDADVDNNVDDDDITFTRADGRSLQSVRCDCFFSYFGGVSWMDGWIDVRNEKYG